MFSGPRDLYYREKRVATLLTVERNSVSNRFTDHEMAKSNKQPDTKYFNNDNRLLSSYGQDRIPPPVPSAQPPRQTHRTLTVLVPNVVSPFVVCYQFGALITTIRVLIKQTGGVRNHGRGITLSGKTFFERNNNIMSIIINTS